MLLAQARETLLFALEVGTVTFMRGAPGLGKTDMIKSVCAELDRPVVVEKLSTMEPIDLRGLPRIDGKTDSVQWARPDFIQRLYDAAATGKRPVLFVDEANAAGQALQVPLMSITLDRRIGPHDLPPGTDIVLAGNRVGDRAAAQRIPSALANRVQLIEVEACLTTWLKWAATNQIAPELIAFLNMRGKGQHNKPGLLHLFDPNAPDQESFPSPRSWVEASKWIKAPDSIREGGIRGIVGEMGSTELEGFLKVWRKLQPLNSIIANPDTAKVPDDSSTKFAVAIALSRAANGANLQAILKYVSRLGKEFEVMTLTDAVKRHADAELHNTTAYINWQAANSDITI